MDKYLAVIDLGSNSASLVIYHQPEKGIIYQIDKLKYVLKLASNFKSLKSI